MKRAPEHLNPAMETMMYMTCIYESREILRGARFSVLYTTNETDSYAKESIGDMICGSLSVL